MPLRRPPIVDEADITPGSEVRLQLGGRKMYTHPDGTLFADITRLFQAMARNSGVNEGFIFVTGEPDSTVIIQEAGHFIERDLSTRLAKLGKDISVFQPYQALPVMDGNLTLGTYQSVLLATKRDKKPRIVVTTVPGTIGTYSIDTGNFRKPDHTRNESDYSKRGGEMIFDITDLLRDSASRVGPGVVYAGTGNTTCVLYHEKNGTGVDGIVKLMDSFALPGIPPYVYYHNNLAARVNVPKDETTNGRAHVLAAILQSSLVFPSNSNGRIYLVELDGPRKERTLYIGFAKGVSYQELINAR